MLIDEYKQEAIHLYLSGLSLTKISKKYNCAINSTKNRLKKWGVYEVPTREFNIKKTKA